MIKSFNASIEKQEPEIRVETWCGHNIRFVKQADEWWAVAKDVCDALDIDNPSMAVHNLEKSLYDTGIKGIISNDTPVKTPGGKQKVLCVNETGLNLLIGRSRKKEAIAFQYWLASEVLPELRKSLGLSQYEAFRLLDKEHQKEAMRRLNESLHEPTKVDYIKANTIADKAVSSIHGFPKLVKKASMSQDMLNDRQPILDDTVQLMALNERFNLGLSISQTVYNKYLGGTHNG